MAQIVVLDTSFILSCVRKKIDFIDDLEFMGFSILVPKQIFAELDAIIRSKQKAHFKEDAYLAIRLLEQSEKKFEEIDLKGSVDQGLINYSQQHRDVYVATLDQELQKKIFNKKIIIRGTKQLEVV